MKWLIPISRGFIAGIAVTSFVTRVPVKKIALTAASQAVKHLPNLNPFIIENGEMK